MGKRLFLLFIFIVSLVLCTPNFLTAKDTVKLTGISNAGVIETIPLPEQAVAAPVAGTKVTANEITIGGKTLEIVTTSDTMVDSGNHVNKYGDKLLYGHNSAAVFGGLKNLSAGNTFKVTMNGNTVSYRISAVQIYDKIDDYTLNAGGKNIKMSVVAKARHGGVYHDLAIMTCHGRMLGNNDATQRLVIFADAI